MTGPTHKVFSVSWAFLATMLMYKYGITEINYYMALIIMLLTARKGALFPDIDHHWQNVKEKTVPNWIINKLIHVTGGKHRSWQTHSLDIAVVCTIISYSMPTVLYNQGNLTLVNKEIMSIIMLGFCCGWLSHMFSDMLTSAGIRLTCFSKFKIAFVPAKIFNFRFNTGNEWEEFVFKFNRGLNMVIGFICMIYPFIQSGTIVNLLNRV